MGAVLYSGLLTLHAYHACVFILPIDLAEGWHGVFHQLRTTSYGGHYGLKCYDNLKRVVERVGEWQDGVCHLRH